MKYSVEKYKNCERFNEQYDGIYRFLLDAEKSAYNEHFHWGRFAWMQEHSFLEEDKLTCITLFRDEDGRIAGMITYDTCYDDRFYLIHTSDDRVLLDQMIDTAVEMERGTVVIKVNSGDAALADALRERQFERKHKDGSVLELDLSGPLEYELPEGYTVNPAEFELDKWQYQLVIHRGFENEGMPEPWDDAVFARGVHKSIRTFAIRQGEYCAHCGVWYTEGDSAYVEPVATVPEHRKKGLAKAVVYEACARARAMGAKRATVLYDQEFYYRIGFRSASEVYCWEKKV